MMDMADRSMLAKLWHERAKITRQDIFGSSDEQLRPIAPSSQADVAVPGMVGENYSSGGLAIVSVNPAGGKDDFRPTAGDAKLYDAAKRISLFDDVQSFEQMNRAYRLGMPSWGAQWRHINAILAATHQSLWQLAYPYLVPFRTRHDKGSALKQDVIDRAYQLGFVEVMRELQPALVIPVDRHSEAAVHRLKIETSMTFEIIYYTRQQNAHTTRTDTLENIARYHFSIPHRESNGLVGDQAAS
ncbi:hypothetical protein TZ53_12385 [Sphingobium sp. YBL2]|nr:hypothetical protein TZ53_12385 [Sphingobium sp. YBL2]